MELIREIEIDKIHGLDFDIQKQDKPYEAALGLFVKKYAQIIVPSIVYNNDEYHFYTLNFQRELLLMKKYGIEKVKFLDLGIVNTAEFKLLRLTLSNVNLEFDPIVISETITDLTRNHGQKNVSSKIGLDKDLFKSYEVLLDFEWGFSSKKEKKIIKDPDQIQIGWDDL